MNTITLLPFQTTPANHLLEVIGKEKVSINASDTGTGKTYMGLFLSEQSNRPTLILCPKATIPNWKRLAPPNVFEIINIEKLKTGRNSLLSKDGKKFTWNLPDNTLVICDEAHQYGGQNSLNAYALAYLKTVPDVHVHLMSATLADSPARFRAFGFLMDLHNFADFNKWAYAHGCFMDEYGNLRVTRNPNLGPQHPMWQLHREIFPRFGIRMKISEIEDFPENTIKTVLTEFSGTPKYKQEVTRYMASLTDEELRGEYGAWANEEVNAKQEENAMVRLLRERQEAELLKLPYLAKEIEDLVEEQNKSVAVFLNFKHSIETLRSMLSMPTVLITGDMNQAEREQSRERFQDNIVPVIIATHGAGGTGIDMHDLRGRPRVSMISPCFHTVQFRQTLGRIHRAGSLSPAIQMVVCQENTTEEMVLKTLDKKLKNLDTLNDGDLQ